MHDPARGWSLSFTGCGFLGFYHIGATRCLSERAPHLLRDARTFFGASAGALHCVTFLAGVPLGTCGTAAGGPRRPGGAPPGRGQRGPPWGHGHGSAGASPGPRRTGASFAASGRAPGGGSSGRGNPGRRPTLTRLWCPDLKEAPLPRAENRVGPELQGEGLTTQGAEAGAGRRLGSLREGQIPLVRPGAAALASAPGWAPPPSPPLPAPGVSGAARPWWGHGVGRSPPGQTGWFGVGRLGVCCVCVCGDWGGG